MLKRTIILTVPLLFAATALGNGWDWDVDAVQDNSEWSESVLQWASDIHPAHPSLDYLEANIQPPPREMWCIDSSWYENCEDWSDHMNDWLHQYLRVPRSAKLPAGLLDYPEECSSTCDDIW